jgi:hypothetical protein
MVKLSGSVDSFDLSFCKLTLLSFVFFACFECARTDFSAGCFYLRLLSCCIRLIEVVLVIIERNRRMNTQQAYIRDPQGDLQARISQLETLLIESISGNVKPETILEERRRALEREWQSVQDLHDEIALVKSELEMGKLPNEPQERRRLYMRKMDALHGKIAAMEAENTVLRQNCKEVSQRGHIGCKQAKSQFHPKSVRSVAVR